MSKSEIPTKQKFFYFLEEFLSWSRSYRNPTRFGNPEFFLSRLEKMAEHYYCELIQENEKMASKQHKKLIKAITNFSL